MNKKVKFIILVLSMLIVGLITFIVVDKVIQNKIDNVSSKSTNQSSSKSVNTTTNNTVNEKKNEVENKVDDKKEVKENTTTDEKKESNKKVESTAASEVRKALKDENWLKKNIYVQDEEKITEGNIGTQNITFLVCKSNDKPIVVVQVLAEDVRYSKVILVSYNDGKVTAQKINQGHIYHGAYSADTNKGVVCTEFMHGGSFATIYFDVSSGSVKFIGEYSSEEDGNETQYFVHDKSMYDEGREISEEEYESYKEGLNEKQYNFVEIGTKLTNENVDKYIK